MKKRMSREAAAAYLTRVLCVWLAGFSSCALLWALAERQTWYAALIGVCLIGLTYLIMTSRIGA